MVSWSVFASVGRLRIWFRDNFFQAKFVVRDSHLSNVQLATVRFSSKVARNVREFSARVFGLT